MELLLTGRWMHADEARKRKEAADADGWHACNTTRDTNRLLFFFASTQVDH